MNHYGFTTDKDGTANRLDERKRIGYPVLDGRGVEVVTDKIQLSQCQQNSREK